MWVFVRFQGSALSRLRDGKLHPGVRVEAFRWNLKPRPETSNDILKHCFHRVLQNEGPLVGVTSCIAAPTSQAHEESAKLSMWQFLIERCSNTVQNAQTL